MIRFTVVEKEKLLPNVILKSVIQEAHREKKVQAQQNPSILLV